MKTLKPGRSKKVLFVNVMSSFTPHFETELELMEDYSQNGAEIHFVRCKSQIPSCFANPSHLNAYCDYCVHRSSQVKAFYPKAIEKSVDPFWKHEDKLYFNSLSTKFPSLRDLYNYRIKYCDINFDIGQAVCCSLVSICRDSSEALLKEQNLIDSLFLTAFYQLVTLGRLIESESYDEVVIFNGRFAIVRGVLRYCQSKKVDIYCHERGGDFYRYALVKQDTIHSLATHKNKLELLKKDFSEKSELYKIGEDFFENQRKGKVYSWKSYITEQEQGKLPDGFEEGLRKVSIFISSEDEFFALDDFKVHFFKDQVEAITYMASQLKEELGRSLSLFVRIHPNLAGIDNHFIRSIKSLEQDGLTVIDADSKVSSYSLVDQSDLILSFGSTVGVEACYVGKPVLLMGTTWYEDLDICTVPESKSDLIEKIKTENKVRNKKDAILYGAYISSFGEKFKYFQPEGIFKGKFKSVRIGHKFFNLLQRAFEEKVFPSFFTKFGEERRSKAIKDLLS
ncbi:MAG: hypothetical protein VX642_07595 [Bdellovibrionota bacterium]|nr:hypothetical protein [Bdellovibrionota bacterium]